MTVRQNYFFAIYLLKAIPEGEEVRHLPFHILFFKESFQARFR